MNTKLIPTPGLEPGPNKGQGFKPCMSTSSIIQATSNYKTRKLTRQERIIRKKRTIPQQEYNSEFLQK